MIRFLLLFIWLPLSALDLSIQSGKEESQPYSILHLKESKPFKCNALKNDFDEIKRIECTISLTRPLPLINNPHFNVTQTATALVITPKTKIALYPIGFDLRSDSEIYTSGSRGVSHWNILGYTKNIPMIAPIKANPNGVNIPLKMAHQRFPFVGGLDLKGNPIKMQNIEDVNGYMELKKAYNAKDYGKAIFLAKEILKSYPNTIFVNELLLYQIRSLHEMGEYESLLSLSKQFIRQYSSDPNIAEVLAYTANAYSGLGQQGDSDYFYDRLFSEHQNSPFASKGMYFKAKHLEVLGSAKKAAQYYREALSRTKDVNLASACAFELARLAMNGDNLEKAKEYLDKISRVNPKYFGEVRSESDAMIELLKERKAYLTAAKITQGLIGSVTHKSSQHELLLKNLGMLYAEGGAKTRALETFNGYIQLFPHGDSINEVKKAKDGLFFENKELNGSDGIKKYDELIERYGNDSIGNQALYKKGQLLFKEGKFEEILKMENDLYKLDTTTYPDANGLIAKSAAEIEKRKLQEGKCSDALSMNKMYKIKLDSAWDGLIFECALKMGNFPLAKGLVEKNSKSKDMATRQRWLYRSVKTHFALGEYSKALQGSKELKALLDVQKNPPLNEVYRLAFDSAQRASDGDSMVESIKGCETLFGSDFKDIERYTQMISLGLKRKDETMVQNYATKVMALQKRTATTTQSPFVEFTLAQSLINKEKNKEALGILKTLDTVSLSPEKRSRQHYLMGSLLMKLGRNKEAKLAFNASLKSDKNSAWGKLAKDALGLL